MKLYASRCVCVWCVCCVCACLWVHVHVCTSVCLLVLVHMYVCVSVPARSPLLHPCHMSTLWPTEEREELIGEPHSSCTHQTR